MTEEERELLLLVASKMAHAQFFGSCGVDRNAGLRMIELIKRMQRGKEGGK